MSDQTMSLVMLDANGFSRVQAIRTNTGASGILSALANMSNAQPVKTWEGPLILYTPSPGSSSYRSANVIATITYLCGDGTEASVKIFAPPIGLFLADLRTIDTTNPLVIALNGQCIGTLESASGSLAASYLSGIITEG